VTLHARVLQRMPVVQALLVAGLALVFIDKVTAPVFASWAAFALGIEALRAVVATRVLRTLNSIDPTRVHRGFVVMAACAGAADGLAAVLFLPRLEVIDQAWLGVVLFAIPRGRGRVDVLAVHPGRVRPGDHRARHGHLVDAASRTSVGDSAGTALQRPADPGGCRERAAADAGRADPPGARSGGARPGAQQCRRAGRADARRRRRPGARRVLAAASHDLRQPLHALSIYSAILAANPSAATLREVGETSTRSCVHWATCWADCSTCRGFHRYLTPERRLFALDAECARICAELRSLAEAKGLSLRTDLPPTQLCGRSDDGRAHRAQSDRQRHQVHRPRRGQRQPVADR
jgi:signal transduction histidine kinase